jgi:hypothetical protein
VAPSVGNGSSWGGILFDAAGAKVDVQSTLDITNLDIAKFAIKRRVSAWFTANP